MAREICLGMLSRQQEMQSLAVFCSVEIEVFALKNSVLIISFEVVCPLSLYSCIGCCWYWSVTTWAYCLLIYQLKCCMLLVLVLQYHLEKTVNDTIVYSLYSFKTKGFSEAFMLGDVWRVECLCPQGGMTEETRSMLALPELTEPPMKPYLNPFPPKGRVYDYKFVKEVGVVTRTLT